MSDATRQSQAIAAVLIETAASSDYSQVTLGHAHYYIQLMATQGPLLRGGGQSDNGQAQAEAMKLLRLESDNILAVMAPGSGRDHDDQFAPAVSSLITFLDLRGMVARAEDRFGSLLSQAEDAQDNPLKVAALLGLAKSRIRSGDYAGGEAYATRARTVAHELEDARNEAAALNEMALCQSHCGYIDSSRELCHIALPLTRMANDDSVEADCMSNLGNIERAAGKHSEAATHLFASLNLSRATGDLRREAAALANLGIVRRVEGDQAGAREFGERALAICRQLGDRHGEALTMMSVGNQAVNCGDLDSAVQCYSSALALFQELGNRHGELLCSSNLGCVGMAQHDWNLARSLFERTLPVLQELGDKPSRAGVLSNLGLCETKLGNPRAASQYLADAIGAYREICKPHKTALCCVWAADVLLDLQLHHPAAVATYAALAEVTRLDIRFDSDEQRTLEEALRRIDLLGDERTVTAEDLARWKAEGEAMTLDELVEFTLAALRRARVEVVA